MHFQTLVLNALHLQQCTVSHIKLGLKAALSSDKKNLPHSNKALKVTCFNLFLEVFVMI